MPAGSGIPGIGSTGSDASGAATGFALGLGGAFAFGAAFGGAAFATTLGAAFAFGAGFAFFFAGAGFFLTVFFAAAFALDAFLGFFAFAIACDIARTQAAFAIGQRLPAATSANPPAVLDDPLGDRVIGRPADPAAEPAADLRVERVVVGLAQRGVVELLLVVVVPQ